MDTKSNGTAEAWRQRIGTQQASNQSIRAWCKDNNCHEHGFYWWRAKLGLSPVSAKARRRPGKPLAFAEFVVDARGADSVRLKLSGGRELILPVSMPIDHVARLLRLLEEPS